MTAESLTLTEPSKSVPRTIVDLILSQARLLPDAAAVSREQEHITYGQLAARSEQLASALAARGVGTEDRVAVDLPSSPLLVSVLLAIWRVGAAYVPLDRRYPAERRRMILADSAAVLLVTDEGGDDLGVAGVTVDELEAMPPRLTPLAGPSPADLAYVIYTSGSTGQPKGVMVEHGNLMDFATADDRLDIRLGETVAHLAPVSFDASVFELWATLASGALVQMFPGDEVSIGALGDFLRATEPDWLFLTTGLFHLLVDHDLNALARVGTLITGGDVLSPEQVNLAARAVRRQMFAAYGPTETTVFASLHAIRQTVTSGRVPLGRPPMGTVFTVLDDDRRVLPPGEVGTLHISGPRVARGYLGNTDLTGQRFVPDPLSARGSARMYDTGDRVCELSDGVFEFHGRVDRQVKIRGFRVELGEIEAVTLTHQDVADAVAMVFDSDASFKRVALFTRGVPGTASSAGELRNWLTERLPRYMMPSAIVPLDAFPLSPNGKVDRDAFPYPWARRDDLGLAAPYSAPCNPVERAMVAAWEDTLNLDRVGRDDNFFELGGDSLRSVALVARLSDEGITIRGDELLDYQTVAELAAAIGEETKAVGHAH
jgi:amino acid adenylation domain-containing protein